MGPFRSYFPVRYYINDFELAATFDPDSEPSSRVVTGLPTTGIRAGEYGREPAPEMLTGSPYCPFRADVWQLGTMFKWTFGVCVVSHASFVFATCLTSQHLGHLSQSLMELFDVMRSEDPSSRPLASVALERVRQLVVSQETLSSEVPKRTMIRVRVSPGIKGTPP